MNGFPRTNARCGDVLLIAKPARIGDNPSSTFGWSCRFYIQAIGLCAEGRRIEQQLVVENQKWHHGPSPHDRHACCYTLTGGSRHEFVGTQKSSQTVDAVPHALDIDLLIVDDRDDQEARAAYP